MGLKTDLNQQNPALVAEALRTAAAMFRLDASELRVAWQDESAGQVWVELAKVLDRAALSCTRVVNRHFE